MSMNLNGFEALEDRVLLAGNVTASINTLTGALTITGDGAANGVSIVDTDGDANGLYEIETDATTNLTLVVDGVATNLGLGANSGDIPGNVDITSIVINLGAGNDEFALVNSEIDGNLNNTALNVTINMGSGNDIIELQGDAYYTNLGNVSIDLGAGNDRFQDLTTIGCVAVLNLSIKAGAGDDLVLLNTEAFCVDNLTINMGTGSDRVDLDGVFGYTNDNVETLSLVFGAGADSLTIDDVEVDRTSIKMNGNNDFVRITDSSFYDSFDLQGGAKADVVEIRNNDFLGVNTLNGGGGNNVLSDLGRNFFSDATTIKSFKIVTV
ncbi:MAG: LEPR-XLL domain-containing protein [Planctomycetales bacterium]|nr:LEPR-XLL domain-containing protein [Planctomycetales bacterium]